jgi:hypothetical protein
MPALVLFSHSPSSLDYSNFYGYKPLSLSDYFENKKNLFQDETTQRFAQSQDSKCVSALGSESTKSPFLVCMYQCMYVHMYVCMYVCMYSSPVSAYTINQAYTKPLSKPP